MGTFLERFKNPLLLLAVVLAQTLWLATQVHRPLRGSAEAAPAQDSRNVSLLRSWSMTVAAPMERLAHGTSAGMQRTWWNYLDLRGARQQNAVLKGEVARLRLEQAAYAQDAAEGRRLEALLQFKQRYVTSTVAAEVIGTSGSDRSHVLWIDKGSDDGLRPEQAVITPDGVVGKLRDVMAHTAQLLLISDPNSGAGAILVSTRLRGIVRGTSDGEVEITNLTADDRIKPGEQVITSGGDQIFPRGLPIGKITRIQSDARHQPYLTLHVQPAANLRQLDEVLVITGTDATPSAAAQQDAAQAEAAAAEENQRAADLVAARLPGLHDAAQADDDAAAATTDGKPAAAAAGSHDPEAKGPEPPQVKVPAHVDRYSPGATPAAAALTPGAPQP